MGPFGRRLRLSQYNGMRNTFPKGVTLLETTLYIGIIGVMLPAFTVFVLHMWEAQTGFDARMRIEQTASLIFLEATHSITEADAIRVSTSTFGTDTGVFRFTDKNSTEVIIDVASTTVSFAGVNQTVRRLRMQRGASAAVWLTDPEEDVTQWRIDPVRNATNVLTGIRISFDAELLNKTGKVYRNATFAGDTTIALSPHTTEL